MKMFSEDSLQMCLFSDDNELLSKCLSSGKPREGEIKNGEIFYCGEWRTILDRFGNRIIVDIKKT